MSSINKWNYPTTIYQGPSTLNQVSTILAENNLSKPLIVTDSFLAKTNKFQEFLEKILVSNSKNKIDYNVFSDLNSDPDSDLVYTALDYLKTNNNDCLIIYGGGSALDLGKTLALMAKHNHELWQFEDGADNYIDLAPSLILPSIAVPTTAGTGSEVGRVAVIIDNQAKRKKFIFHPNLVPNWVILDPMVTLELPQHLTAATGMDALTHAIEAYCVNNYHPMADGIALESIKLINNNLVTAYNHSDNILARANMLTASTMAATAFQKGLGAVHSLSHPIGALFKLHHGLLNALFLPYVLKLNNPVIEHKMQELIRYLNIEPNSNFKSNTELVINWLLQLKLELNMPHSFQDLEPSIKSNLPINIELLADSTSNEFNFIITEALLDPSTATNPVQLNYENLSEVLKNTYNGII